MISSRLECRSGEKRCQPSTEAEAMYCQGNHAEATRTELAETMDVNPSTLGNWLDPQHTSRMPDDRREQLLRLTDDHVALVRYHIERQGLAFYDPRTDRGKGVTRMVAEFGELLQALDEITADHVITPDEARRFEREAGELHGAVDAKVREIKRAAGLLEAEC